MHLDLQVIVCPKCKGPQLRQEEGTGLSCPQCRVQFPVLDGIPILFSNPESYLLLWSMRLQNRELEIEQNKKKTIDLPSFSGLSHATQKRLTQNYQAERENLGVIRSLLPETVALFKEARPFEFIKTKELGIGNTQHFGSYVETIFRDWVWGEQEVQKTVESILPKMRSLLKGRETKLAALGSGAGRLISELAKALPESQWVGLDINPLLLQIHAKMLSQQEVSYWEIPHNPRSLQDVAVKQMLRSPDFSSIQERISLIASDGLNPPFKSKSLDALLCSWWVDIVPDDLQNVFARLNRVLAQDGLLFVHGPLGFSAPHESRSYTEDEILEWIPKVGFELVERDHFEEPYLHSPHGRLKRLERLSWFVFKKVAEAKQPSAFKAHPDYLLNPDLPIGPTEEFQFRAADGALRQQIFSLIDGKRSFNDLAQLVSSGLQIDLASTKLMLEQILTS